MNQNKGVPISLMAHCWINDIESSQEKTNTDYDMNKNILPLFIGLHNYSGNIHYSFDPRPYQKPPKNKATQERRRKNKQARKSRARNKKK